MRVKGFQGTSLLDFPGRVASLVFTGGCNLSCPFCHNPGLVLDPGQYPDYPLEELLADLERRSNFIDGVAISGGEPTLEPGLAEFLRRLKGLGLQVKLDSNGLLPEVLEQLLAEQLVDYLAIDLKTAPARYGELHSAPVSTEDLERSLQLVMACGVAYEFRTTCVPGLVEEGDLVAMGEVIRGARLWVLQQFVPQHALAEELQGVEPHPPERLHDFVALAKNYAEEVRLRGV